MSDNQSKVSAKKTYLRLLRYVRPYTKVFILSFILMMVSGLLEPVLPAVLKPLLDNGFSPEGNTSTAWHIPALIIVIAIFRGLLYFASSYLIGWMSAKVSRDLKVDLFNKLMRLPSNFYDSRTNGEIFSKAVSEPESAVGAATDSLNIILKDGLSIFGLLCWLIYLNWKLMLLIILITPFIILTVRTSARRVRENAALALHFGRRMATAADEGIKGQRTVKLFNAQGYESQRYQAVTEDLRKFEMKTLVSSSFATPIVQLLSACALSLVIYIAIIQAANDETTVGSFVSFITAMLMLLAPLKRVTNLGASIQRGLLVAESMFEILDEPEEDAGDITHANMAGKITIDSVSFQYPNTDQKALKNISLTIQLGQVAAVVGRSGSGKTTLVNLITKIYTLQEGNIYIDENNINLLAIENLRKHVAYVSQDIFLFNDNIIHNIAYGQPPDQVDLKKIEAAAKDAYAHDFIMELPQGYQTLVGNNGILLSGGQKQRIAIARALYKNAPILILDEATSALDNESEKYIQIALKNLMKNRTTLLIAHRLSTVIDSDKILVMSDGQIIEEGTHQDLMSKNGSYAALYRLNDSHPEGN